MERRDYPTAGDGRPAGLPAEPVYLDYNATTPVDARVAEAARPYWDQWFGNPSSDHAYSERPRQAALFGLALVFTKEPGVLVYALATGLWALLLVARREGTVPEKLRRLARAWPLSLPLAAFGGFMVFRLRGGVDPLWHNFGHVSLLDTFTTFRLLDQSFIGQLLGIFALQFA